MTPYKGKLDPGVAKAILWDNSKDVEFNVQHSNWRSAKANLTAGAQTMLGKARSIKGGVPTTWEQMDPTAGAPCCTRTTPARAARSRRCAAAAPTRR
ncbi:MAG TPA: hypothetical protein VF516_38685 [Kofleriaceae bacterium]